MAARKLRELLETEDRSLSKLVDLLAELSLRIVREIPRTLGTTDGVNISGEEQTAVFILPLQRGGAPGLPSLSRTESRIVCPRKVPYTGSGDRGTSGRRRSANLRTR